jgi:hypothetical protein
MGSNVKAKPGTALQSDGSPSTVIVATGATNERSTASSEGGGSSVVSVVSVVSAGCVVAGASVTFVTMVVATSVAVVVVSIESPLVHEATIKARTPMIGSHLALMIHLLGDLPATKCGGNSHLAINVLGCSVPGQRQTDLADDPLESVRRSRSVAT